MHRATEYTFRVNPLPTLPAVCDPRNGDVVFLTTGRRGLYQARESGLWTPVDATNLYNVKAFGALGNGAHDDTASIQAAINARAADYLAGLGGGMVFLPAGTYRITAPLLISTGYVHLLGAPPATILQDGIGNVFTITDINVTLSFIRAGSTAQTNAGYVIEGNGAMNLVLNHCDLLNAQLDALHLVDSFSSTFRDSIFYANLSDPGSAGVHLGQNSNNMKFERCDFNPGAQNTGCRIIAGSSITLDECSIQGNFGTSIGLDIHPDVRSVSNVRCHGYFESNDVAIRVRATGGNIPRGIDLSRNFFSMFAPNMDGILIDECNGLKADENVFAGNGDVGTVGITVNNSASVVNCEIGGRNTNGGIATPVIDAGFRSINNWTNEVIILPRNTIPVFANNAAAVAGGVPVRGLYRTNADPDILCIVH